MVLSVYTIDGPILTLALDSRFTKGQGNILRRREFPTILSTSLPFKLHSFFTFSQLSDLCKDVPSTDKLRFETLCPIRFLRFKQRHGSSMYFSKSSRRFYRPYSFDTVILSRLITFG